LVMACIAALVGAACSASSAAPGNPTPVRTTAAATALPSAAGPTTPPSPVTSPPAPSVIPSPTFPPVVAPASCHPSTGKRPIALASTQFLFPTKCLGVAAGVPFAIRYRTLGGLGNPDHNVSIYRDPGGLSTVFRGGIVLAKHAHTYHVKSLPAGVYM